MKQQHSKHLPCFTLEKVIICCLATPASTCSAPEQVEDFLQLHQTSKRSHRGLQSYRSRGRRRFFCWFVVRQTHRVFSGGPGGSWEFTCYIFLQVATRGRGLTRTFFSAEKMDHSAATRFPFLSNFLIYPETGKARMRRLITVYLYSYISKIYLFSVKLYGWCDIFTFTVGCHTYVTRDVCCTRKWSSDTSFLLTSPWRGISLSLLTFLVKHSVKLWTSVLYSLVSTLTQFSFQSVIDTQNKSPDLFTFKVSINFTLIHISYLVVRVPPAGPAPQFDNQLCIKCKT